MIGSFRFRQYDTTGHCPRTAKILAPRQKASHDWENIPRYRKSMAFRNSHAATTWSLCGPAMMLRTVIAAPSTFWRSYPQTEQRLSTAFRKYDYVLSATGCEPLLSPHPNPLPQGEGAIRVPSPPKRGSG